MFWVYCVASMLGSALNYVFIARLVRSLPTFQAIAYRGFGLAVTMLPFIVLFANRNWWGVGPYLFEIFLASVLTMLSLFFFFEGMKQVSIGVSNAVRQSFIVVALAIMGLVFLSNELLIWHWFLIVLIVLGNVVFRVSREGDLMASLQNKKGISLCLVSGILGGLGMFFMGKVSQAFDPFISGYLWEIGIAVLALLFSFFKKEFNTAKFDLQKYWLMLWASSPTIFATFGFALAATLGPIGIIGAIQAGSIVVIAVLSLFLYREKLSLLQWFAIGIITMAIIAFRLI